MTTAGIVTAEFTLPDVYAQPTFLSNGPDGNIWINDGDRDKITRSTLTGTMTEFPIRPQQGVDLASPTAIISGPDGNLWFGEGNGNKVGRLTPQGVLKEFTPPTAYACPYFLAAGPDGSIWFTEVSANEIGRLTP
jgi:virginiamycin B lyase